MILSVENSKNVITENKERLQAIVDAVVQDPSIDKNVKVQLIIHATSLICAIVAVQPIPFADIFVLSPIQLIMVTALNKILDNPFEKSSLKEIFTSLLGVVGWGTLAQHLILGLYKTVLPFMGALTTIPLVYGATYALGTGAKILIAARRNDQTVSDKELKRAVAKAKKEAEESQKKLGVKDAVEQISQMFSKAEEYQNYKNEMLRLNKKITSAYKDDVYENANVTAIVETKKRTIKRRFAEKYEHLEFNDYILSMLAVMDYKGFIERAEPVIGELNFRFSEMDVRSSAGYGEGTFYDVNSDIGTLFIKVEEKREILGIGFKEEFQENSLIQYMANPSLNLQVLQDQQIKEKFHDMLQKAEQEILIISPWVGKWPYKEISEILKEKKSVSIKVLYGINDTSGSVKRQDDSDSYIQKYKSTVGRNFSSKKTNTHVKLVICDERCYLLGSMNVMSFSADYDKSPWLHHEVSLFSRDRETIRKLKKAYFNW